MIISRLLPVMFKILRNMVFTNAHNQAYYAQNYASQNQNYAQELFY